MKIIHGGFTQSKDIERARIATVLKHHFSLILSYSYMIVERGKWNCQHTFAMVKRINQGEGIV